MHRSTCLLLAFLLLGSSGCLRDLDLDFETPCSEIDCDDDNPCTIDSCVNYLDLFGTGVSGPTCEYEPGNSGGACGMEGFTCRDGLCGEASLCDGVDCDDGDPCTDDRCAWNGVCQYEPIVCEDDDPCTENVCDPQTGQCDFSELAPDGTFCWVDLDNFEAGGCEEGTCTGPCPADSEEEQACPVDFALGQLSCCPGEESCLPGCG